MPSKKRHDTATRTTANRRRAADARETKEARDKAIRRVASVLRRGQQGLALARTLVKRGIRTRAALRRPEIIRQLPKEFQINIMYPEPPHKVSLAEADALMNELIRRIIFCPVKSRPNGCYKLPLYVVGSIRRRCPRIGDVDMLVHFPARLASATEQILYTLRLSDPEAGDRAILMDVEIGGDRHRTLIIRWAPIDDGHTARRPSPKFFHVDLFVTIGDELPFALYHYTGSRRYNIRTRAYAKRKGYTLNQYGIWTRTTGKKVPGTSGIKSEKDIAEFLGVSYREPTDRER